MLFLLHRLLSTTPMCMYIWITSDWERLFWVDFPSLLSTRRLKPRPRQIQSPKVLVFFLLWQWPMSKPSLTCIATCLVSQQQYRITHNTTERKMLTSQTIWFCWSCCKRNRMRVPHTKHCHHCFSHPITNLLYLNVFEMNFLILAKIHNRTQEVEQAFIALEWLKKINEGLCGQLLMVFGCNLEQNIEFIIIPSQNTWEMGQNEMGIISLT